MRDERGVSVSVEAAVILPAFVAVIGLIVCLARLVLAEHDVSAVAANAARAGSLERSPGAASVAAAEMVDASMEEHGPPCEAVEHRVDFSTVAGQRLVAVEVRCAVGLADIAVLPLPGSITVVGSANSPVDVHRQR